MIKAPQFVPVNLFSSLSEKEVAKIGSLLHLIAKKSNNIFLTRLMKLLYLVDETSVKEIGVPVTALKYSVAKDGPLAVNVWKELTGTNYFGNFIDVSMNTKYEGGLFITPSGIPTLDLFTDYEIELISRTVEQFKSMNVRDLIEYIHNEENSLWKKIVDEHEIQFVGSKSYITEYEIDLANHIKNDETLSDFYNCFMATRR